MRRKSITSYPGYPEQVDEHPELKRWATEFCTRAVAADENVDFGDDGGTDGSAGNTVRLVCELYDLTEWDDFLRWQQYGGPRGKGPWYVLDCFEEPYRWTGAQLYVRNPWDVAFSRFFMASGMEDVTFQMRRRDGKAIDPDEYAFLAAAIVDGMRWDYDDEEFQIILTKKPKRLVVRLWNAEDAVEGVLNGGGTGYRPNKAGYMWTRK